MSISIQYAYFTGDSSTGASTEPSCVSLGLNRRKGFPPALVLLAMFSLVQRRSVGLLLHVVALLAHNLYLQELLLS